MRETYGICLMKVFMKFTLSQTERRCHIVTGFVLYLFDTFLIETIITSMHALLSPTHSKVFEVRR